VIQTVREKFTCRSCGRISQAPAPFHPTPRGWAGPSLLAMILFEKYGQHQPLNRQSERYAREGVELSVSTLADQVGACAVALRPLHDLIAAHVLAAERIHGDDTTVPVLAKGKADTARAWVYVRDDRPFGGTDPPAALFHYSRDRRGEHPERHLADFSGILQADAFAGYNRLFDPDRSPGPITEAPCWAHARRKFFVLADLAMKARRGKQGAVISPLALEAVKRIDALFDVEREINGLSAEKRLAVRKERSAPLLADLEAWMREERARLSRHVPVAKAMDYMLNRRPGFARFLEDGRICLTNNAAERALRGIALGRNYAHRVIMRSSPREAPARLTHQRFPARRTAHNSKALKELHQLVRWPIPTRARSDRLQAVEGALLHREIGLEVHMRRGGALVAQPEGDHGDVDAGLQEMHRRGVADCMRRYRASRELGVTLRGSRDCQVEALGDVRARHPFSAPTWEQDLVIAGTLQPVLPAPDQRRG